jgi:enterochelin esterase-like enzyme
MTVTERIADQIAGVLMGLSLAGVLGLVMRWLWPEMTGPVLVVFLLSWTLTTISNAVLRRRDAVRTSPSGWKYIKGSPSSRKTE